MESVPPPYVPIEDAQVKVAEIKLTEQIIEAQRLVAGRLNQPLCPLCGAQLDKGGWFSLSLPEGRWNRWFCETHGLQALTKRPVADA